MKKALFLFLFLPIFLCCSGFVPNGERNCEDTSNPPIDAGAMEFNLDNTADETNSKNDTESPKKDFIKWIDFNVTRDVLAAAQLKHVEMIEQEVTSIGTCELLAYVALKNGNKFNSKTDKARLKKLTADNVREYMDNKYFKYYTESYHAVLDGIIDPHTAEITGHFPLAKGFWYNHSDDFGNSRVYGYKRRHLGNDIFGGTGTPIIAVEGGTVTELGWNRYGGWRVGIRSDDTKRYYYYAHLRKNKPFAMNLKLGDRVESGDVIGYLGRTGYSRKENTNMTGANPHLHFGMQIIFDKSQEDGPTELWIDVYQISKFLSRNRAQVVKNPETKEYESVKAKKHLFPKQLL